MGKSKVVGLLVGMAVLIVAPEASAACGQVSINPNPGWRGASITISGTEFTPGSQIFVNFGGTQIGTTTSTADGAFALNYTIPQDFPVGDTNIFAQDAPANCEANPSYTVNASAPTPSTTTAPTTTSTVADTTTTTTSVTTSSLATTTSTSTVTTVADGSGGTDESTTTVPPDATETSSGLPWVLAALLGAGLFVLGVFLGRRSSSDRR